MDCDFPPLRFPCLARRLQQPYSFGNRTHRTATTGRSNLRTRVSQFNLTIDNPMKCMHPSRFCSLTLGAAALIFAPLAASAVLINGSISFRGSVNLDAPIPTANSFVSFEDVGVTVGTQTGDYVGTGGTTGVTMNGFQFSPTLAPDPVSPVWQFAVGPTNYSFVLDDIVSVTRMNLGAGLFSLQVAGTGTASITGFDSTPGAYSVTTTGDNVDTSLGFGAFTFVAGKERVPDGGTSILLFGLALTGLGVARKYRKS